MTSSVKEALLDAARKALEAKTAPPAPVAAVLHQTVDDWSKDDPAHANAKPQLTTKEKAMQVVAQTTVATPAPGTAPGSKPHHFQETCGVSRATFEYTRDHPEKTHSQIVQDLVAKGFKLTSVDSLLYQMTCQHMLRRTDAGTYVALQKEYAPMKAAKTLRNMKARQQEAAAARKTARAEKAAAKKTAKKTVRGVKPVKATAPAAPAPERTAPALHEMSSDQIMQHLTVLQARTLYMKLKEVFGGQ